MIRLTVSMIGTVVGRDPPAGDPKDPLRPADIDFGNVSWKMISIDVDAMTMDIEVTAATRVAIPVLDASGKQAKDKNGGSVWAVRETTPQDQQQYLDFAAAAAAGTPAPCAQAEASSTADS